ncbi:MAG: hypothetical protein ABL952_17990, partial [Pyrinomonadaceae bacterium]
MSSSEPKNSQRPAIVEVVLPVPVRRAFTYRVPTSMQGTIRPGARLTLPFGKRNLTGYAVELHEEIPAGLDIDVSKLKDVIEVLDEEPLITPEILKLTQWTADYYASFWGEMLKASLPAGLNNDKVKPKRRKAVRLRNADAFVRPGAADAPVRPSDTTEAAAKPITAQQQSIIDLLISNNG